MENGLASQFIKQEIEINFWRDKNKNEIDFILSLGDGKTAALEIKLRLKKIFMPGIKTFQELHPGIQFYYVSLDIGRSFDNAIKALPACFL